MERSGGCRAPPRPVDAPPVQLRCAECRQVLQRDAFSRSQLNKNRKLSACLKCTERRRANPSSPALKCASAGSSTAEARANRGGSSTRDAELSMVGLFLESRSGQLQTFRRFSEARARVSQPSRAPARPMAEAPFGSVGGSRAKKCRDAAEAQVADTGSVTHSKAQLPAQSPGSRRESPGHESKHSKHSLKRKRKMHASSCEVVGSGERVQESEIRRACPGETKSARKGKTANPATGSPRQTSAGRLGLGQNASILGARRGSAVPQAVRRHRSRVSLTYTHTHTHTHLRSKQQTHTRNPPSLSHTELCQPACRRRVGQQPL